MTQEITGTVTEKIYESADGYTVVEIEGDEPAVVVGNMPDIKTGELTRFFGAYKTHPKYGRQFVATSYESTLPSDLNDIVLFLGGGFIKGLGEVLATRIVETFGEETFEVIEHAPMRLAQVKGVSKRLAQSVQAAFSEYAQKKYVYAELMGMGLTAHQANIIVGELGSGAPTLIRENPYLLIDRVRGIDFISADQIAARLGIGGESPFRVKNGVLNVLKKMLAAGNMYVVKSKLIPHVAERLGVSQEVVRRQILAMVQEETIVLRRFADGFETVFLKSAYQAEMQAAARLFCLRGEKEQRVVDCLEELLEKQKKAFSLTEEQIEAVRCAVSNRVCIITGGPGTGKTTILKAVLHVFGAAGVRCALAAPTGRAAKRMQEATGESAKTIHRLLEYSYDEDAYQCYFRINEENPLDTDAVIVDEVSMLDVFLFRNLLAALKDGTRLILVGDADQLPSVGPGNVMRDMISSGVVPCVMLTYRFRNEGNIADAAYEILQGNTPRFDEKEFVFLECDTKEEVLQCVRDLYLNYYKQGADVQTIGPIKKTETGTVALNAMLRDTVNPARTGKTELLFGDRVFREGDRVMQIKNNYARKWRDYSELSEGEGVFNGDIGVIAEIRAGVVKVRFEDGKECAYELMELAELDGAFAYTIHKSQGSEFDVVILPMLYEVNPFFTRNLLYTAVTRARKKVVVAGDRRTLGYMIRNGKRGARATALAKELNYLNRVTGR